MICVFQTPESTVYPGHLSARAPEHTVTLGTQRFQQELSRSVGGLRVCRTSWALLNRAGGGWGHMGLKGVLPDNPSPEQGEDDVEEQ